MKCRRDYTIGWEKMLTWEYVVRNIEADPSDDKFLACALEGDADCIVSEDPQLRDLKAYQGIQIVSMAQVL